MSKDRSGPRAAVVLAAGLGKRMKSGLPKVLHQVCGASIIDNVLDAVEQLELDEIVVVIGHGADAVRARVGARARCVLQEEQKGTGHAAMIALGELDARFREVLVLPGDSPLVTASSLRRLIDTCSGTSAAAALLTARVDDPTGYGRVMINGEGKATRIVEETDATEEEREVCDINASMYAFDRELLQGALSRLKPENVQGEYYLTDVVELLMSEGRDVVAIRGKAEEALGINDREQLAAASALMRRRINARLMAEGVTIVDPEHTYIDRDVEIGRDTVVLPMVFLAGATRIGADCIIGPSSELNDSVTGDRCEVNHSWMYLAEIGDDVNIGPYAKLRPGTRVEDGAKVGSFVELKNTVVGKGSKIPHLSYVGDAEIGEAVNIGAGTITCNYDGKNKGKTTIGDGAFIGSDTMLVAPVDIGEGAVTGAGSTICKDVPGGALGIERSEQVNVEQWKKNRDEKN